MNVQKVCCKDVIEIRRKADETARVKIAQKEKVNPSEVQRKGVVHFVESEKWVKEWATVEENVRDAERLMKSGLNTISIDLEKNLDSLSLALYKETFLEHFGKECIGLDPKTQFGKKFYDGFRKRNPRVPHSYLEFLSRNNCLTDEHFQNSITAWTGFMLEFGDGNEGMKFVPSFSGLVFNQVDAIFLPDWSERIFGFEFCCRLGAFLRTAAVFGFDRSRVAMYSDELARLFESIRVDLGHNQNVALSDEKRFVSFFDKAKIDTLRIDGGLLRSRLESIVNSSSLPDFANIVGKAKGYSTLAREILKVGNLGSIPSEDYLSNYKKALATFRVNLLRTSESDLRWIANELHKDHAIQNVRVLEALIDQYKDLSEDSILEFLVRHYLLLAFNGMLVFGSSSWGVAAEKHRSFSVPGVESLKNEIQIIFPAPPGNQQQMAGLLDFMLDAGEEDAPIESIVEALEELGSISRLMSDFLCYLHFALGPALGSEKNRFYREIGVLLEKLDGSFAASWNSLTSVDQIGLEQEIGRFQANWHSRFPDDFVLPYWMYPGLLLELSPSKTLVLSTYSAIIRKTMEYVRRL